LFSISIPFNHHSLLKSFEQMLHLSMVKALRFGVVLKISKNACEFLVVQGRTCVWCSGSSE
jgi:hypothetical protein